MHKRFLLVLLACCLSSAAFAQAKQRIEKAADMPRFSYTIDRKLEELVRDEAAFRGFAEQVRRDHQSVLEGYEIADKAAHRELLTVLAQVDFLEGRYAEAAKRAEEVRALEEKPADKLVSGMGIRSMVAAEARVGNAGSEAYREEVGRQVAAELAQYPYPVIANDIKTYNRSAEIMGEALLLGSIRDRLQPVVDKAGGVLSSDFAPAIISTRYALMARLPLKQTLIDTYGAYLAANKVEKPDIWAARDVALPEGRNHAPVTVAVWDSGVDSLVFRDRVVRDGEGKPRFLAFDVYENPSTSELASIPAQLRSRIPAMKVRMKGLSDLQSNIDSPEASEVKATLSQLKSEEYKGVMEELGLAGNYSHGTHVAGIAIAGNPYARLVNARIEFGYKLLPDPCPSRELVEKNAKNAMAFVEFFRSNGVRVVNMSWGGRAKGVEGALELCNIGNTPEERARIAREYFDLQKKGLQEAIASAPEILFLASAGNSNADAAFEEAIPSDIVLPNLLTVGAVDQAGDEAPFTSYGPTVKAHANGYQVESYIPGGDRVAFSGTSMASPQVAGLAAKMLAVNPKLTPPEVIAIIQQTLEKTADGRRLLVHPARAVAAAQTGPRLYVFDCGAIQLAGVSDFGLKDEETPVRELFVPCYVVEHAKGRLLWDGGLSLKVAEAPGGRVEAEGYGLTYRRSIVAQLADMQLLPADIGYAAFSHLHFDHVGAAGAFPSATVLMQRTEWDYQAGVGREHMDAELLAALERAQRTIIDGDHDVFGDGSVRIVFAPGHTPGHQVLLVNLEHTGPVLLSGDLYHFRESRALRRAPTFNHDAAETFRSMDKVEALLQRTGATLWIEHDKALADTLKKAPAYYD